MDGPKILLVGDSGSGKTTALAALAKAGITPNILMLDDGTRVPAILNSPPGVVNYHRHRDTGLEWSDLKAMSKSLRTKTNKQIQEEDRVGARNSLSFDQMVDVVIQEFIDDRTGTSLGSALEWGPEQAFCLDSVSELNDICQHTAVGAKAIQSIADWGAMMNLEERFLKKCLLALPCPGS
jgi:energy-coupling factor transporter ATP-binding protein EcfA2